MTSLFPVSSFRGENPESMVVHTADIQDRDGAVNTIASIRQHWANIDLSRRVARLLDTKNGERRDVPPRRPAAPISRHEATSRLFEKGLGLMDVAAITGHKTFAMLKRYAHLRAEDLAAKLG